MGFFTTFSPLHHQFQRLVGPRYRLLNEVEYITLISFFFPLSLRKRTLFKMFKKIIRREFFVLENELYVNSSTPTTVFDRCSSDVNVH